MTGRDSLVLGVGRSPRSGGSRGAGPPDQDAIFTEGENNDGVIIE